MLEKLPRKGFISQIQLQRRRINCLRASRRHEPARSEQPTGWSGSSGCISCLAHRQEVNDDAARSLVHGLVDAWRRHHGLLRKHDRLSTLVRATQ